MGWPVEMSICKSRSNGSNTGPPPIVLPSPAPPACSQPHLSVPPLPHLRVSQVLVGLRRLAARGAVVGQRCQGGDLANQAYNLLVLHLLALVDILPRQRRVLRTGRGELAVEGGAVASAPLGTLPAAPGGSSIGRLNGRASQHLMSQPTCSGCRVDSAQRPVRMVPMGCASWGSAAIVASTDTGSAATRARRGGGQQHDEHSLDTSRHHVFPGSQGQQGWTAASPQRHVQRAVPHPSAASPPPSSAAAAWCWAGCRTPPGTIPAVGSDHEGSAGSCTVSGGAEQRRC